VTERKLLVLSIISDARVAASLTGNENNKSLSGSRHKSSATLRKKKLQFSDSDTKLLYSFHVSPMSEKRTQVLFYAVCLL
jgi:hypothetical protein